MILAAAAVVFCLDAQTRESSRTLMLEGIDMALKQQTAKLFENRLHDREESPERVIAGMRGTLRAYRQSRAAILAWAPPPCGERP
jgi:hypothetical protein